MAEGFWQLVDLMLWIFGLGAVFIVACAVFLGGDPD